VCAAISDVWDEIKDWLKKGSTMKDLKQRDVKEIAANIVILTDRPNWHPSAPIVDAIATALQTERDRAERAEATGEQQADDDWLSAVQSFDWGEEVSLAEGNEIASEARQEVIGSIHEIVQALRTRAEKAKEISQQWFAAADKERTRALKAEAALQLHSSSTQGLRDQVEQLTERLDRMKWAAKVADNEKAAREKAETAIRKHRDQRGDDRCWMDDEELYKILPEGYTPPLRDSAVELKNCQRFIDCRNNPATTYVSPQRMIEELRIRAEKAETELTRIKQLNTEQTHRLMKAEHDLAEAVEGLKQARRFLEHCCCQGSGGWKKVCDWDIRAASIVAKHEKK
jgi:chromosome segregation ATPase